MALVLHPTVLWAQRKDLVLLTIDLQDAKVRAPPRRDAPRRPRSRISRLTSAPASSFPAGPPDQRHQRRGDQDGARDLQGQGPLPRHRYAASPSPPESSPDSFPLPHLFRPRCASHVAQLHSSHAGDEERSYELDLELFAEVDPADVKQATTGRSITLAIPKKEAADEHWPRLLKAAGKAPQFLKVDWDRWVDEDDEGEEAGAGGGDAGGFDFSQFAAMNGGGMGGGMGGMNVMNMGGGGGGGGGMDMAALQAMMGGAGGAGGMGGMGGEEGSDSGDDEGDDDLPPLEPAGAPPA
jgi:hypothetical protein